MQATFEQEVKQGERFQFGKNWTLFLSNLNEDRITRSQQALQKLLGVNHLQGKSFLDIGSGSGLSSLAARRLGARVVSFDYDPDSVACTEELKRRFFPQDQDWKVMPGSVLDPSFLAQLGTFEYVYSWGVLHHTGNMWQALENTASLVAPGGTLTVAIYNDQENRSDRWRRVKKLYCSGPLGKALVCSVFIPKFFLRGVLEDLVRMRNPVTRYTQAASRGMSVYRDWFDWLGGFPFEVARPEQIFKFYQARGFVLKNLSTVGGSMGCNEFLFIKDRASGAVLPRELHPQSQEMSGTPISARQQELS